MALLNERRKRVRVDLHWTVLLTRKAGKTPIETRTENLSSDGFYCFSSEPLTPGEQLDCVIIVPIRREETLWLECRIGVVRVEIAPPGTGYGVGCRIEDYRIMDGTRAAVVAAEGVWAEGSPA